MGKIRSYISRNVYNMRGWRTNRKIVVIESDDWGTIRTPSKQVYDKLLSKGISVDKSPFSKYDTLASEDDLSALFDVLNSVKDKNGRSAVITANAVVANPDFDKIRNANYEEYFYEPFPETLKKYGMPYENSWLLWQQGIKDRIFIPQFHGREHLNVSLWLSDLQNRDKDAQVMFDSNNWTYSKSSSVNYMAGFIGQDKIDVDHYRDVLSSGMSLFEELFGYTSKSFIAPCYIWGNSIEQSVAECGVKYIQGLYRHKDTESGKMLIQSIGKQNNLGQTYLMRNVLFEPSILRSNDYVGDAMKAIETAFFWKKPATICSHRLNFIGSIDEKNRKDNLKTFGELLRKIVKRWPDVEFISSDELGDLITSK